MDVESPVAPRDPIVLLRSQAIAEYRRLEAEVAGLDVQWNGALTYTPAALAAPRSGRGDVANVIMRPQIGSVEPALRNLPAEAVHHPEHGGLDAVAATHALVAAAVRLGAKLLTGVTVTRLWGRDGETAGVETTGGRMEADVVVCVAGTGIPALAEAAGVSLPVEASPAVFIRYGIHPGFVRSIVSGPDFEIRQGADGVVLAAEDFVGDCPEHSPEALAARTAEAVGHHFQGVGPLSVDVARVGLRPIAADGLPIIGFLPQHSGIYVCTMHPGVTLAAVAGRLASQEILGMGGEQALLPCRPDRFLRDSAPGFDREGR